MISTRKWFLSLSILLTIIWGNWAMAAPPIPARIGGKITIEGVQLTHRSDPHLTVFVTGRSGSAYTPNAICSEGLNAHDWYVINVPSYDKEAQPGGAKPGDTAVIHVHRNGKALKIVSPGNGEFVVGPSGSTTRIDIVAEN